MTATRPEGAVADLADLVAPEELTSAEASASVGTAEPSRSSTLRYVVHGRPKSRRSIHKRALADCAEDATARWAYRPRVSTLMSARFAEVHAEIVRVVIGVRIEQAIGWESMLYVATQRLAGSRVEHLEIGVGREVETGDLEGRRGDAEVFDVKTNTDGVPFSDDLRQLLGQGNGRSAGEAEHQGVEGATRTQKIGKSAIFVEIAVFTVRAAYSRSRPESRIRANPGDPDISSERSAR